MQFDLRYLHQDFAPDPLTAASVVRAIKRAPKGAIYAVTACLLPMALLVVGGIWLVALGQWVCSMTLLVPITAVYFIRRVSRNNLAGSAVSWETHRYNAPLQLLLDEEGIQICCARFSEKILWSMVNVVEDRGTIIAVGNKYASIWIPKRIFSTENDLASFHREVKVRSGIEGETT